MEKKSFCVNLWLKLLLALFLMNFSAKGQGENNTAKATETGTKYYNQTLNKFVINPLDSLILKPEDFSEFAETILGELWQKICDKAIKGEIFFYKNSNLTKVYSNNELIKYFGGYAGLKIILKDTTVLVNGKSQILKDTIYKIEYNAVDYLKASNVADYIELIPTNGKLNSYSIDNVNFGIMFNMGKINSELNEKVFYLSGNHLEKIINNEQLIFLKNLITYLVSSKLKNESNILTPSLISGYINEILYKTNLKLYKDVLSSKIIPYRKYNQSIVKDLPETVRTRNLECETVSVQIDPNDPYKTKDSTVCFEFTKDTQHVKMAVKIDWKKGGKLIYIEPMLGYYYSEQLTSYMPMFLLKIKEATPLLEKDEQWWIENVLNFKLKKISEE